MTTTDIPTITTTDEATALLRELAEHHDWVSVFWDRGWGDSGQALEVSIIVDGNGQKPKAWITREVYKELLARHTIKPNSLQTLKARKLHDFKSSPEPEETGPKAIDVAERVIRGLLDELRGQPIRVRFFRGLTAGPRARVREEIVDTPPVKAGWFVLLCPGGDSVTISANEPTFLGPDIIGRGIADRLAYPTSTDGGVDVKALAGPAFRAELTAAIEEKLAAIAAVRTH